MDPDPDSFGPLDPDPGVSNKGKKQQLNINTHFFHMELGYFK